MNMHFGKLLRDELKERIAAEKLARKSSIKSQESQALSAGGFNSDDENDQSTFSSQNSNFVFGQKPDEHPFARPKEV